ncbi:MAG: ABC transporter permease [Methanomassiliicoccales archaeon]
MSASLIQGTASISSKIGMSEQVAVPKQIFPLVDLIMETVLSGVAFILIFMMMIYEGVPFTWHIVEIIPISMIVFVFLFGAALIFSHYGAFIADLRPALNYTLRFVFYLSPIFYERARMPSELGLFYQLNPVAIIIDGYRDALIYGSSPDYVSLLVVLLIGFLLIFIGLRLINKYDKDYCKIK